MKLFIIALSTIVLFVVGCGFDSTARAPDMDTPSGTEDATPSDHPATDAWMDVDEPSDMDPVASVPQPEYDLVVSVEAIPAREVGGGDQDEVFYRLSMMALRERLEVRRFPFQVSGIDSDDRIKGTSGTDHLRDVKLKDLDTGATVMGPISLPPLLPNGATSSGGMMFGDAFFLEPGVPRNLLITMDISNAEDAPGEFFGGTHRFRVALGWGDGQFLDLGSVVRPGGWILDPSRIQGNSTPLGPEITVTQPYNPCLDRDEPHDGLDNDCDGWVDNDQRLHGDNVWTCNAERGCYWFCDSIEAHGSDMYGFRGCCTSGRFQTDEAVPLPGMLIKGSLSAVYYVASDGKRYIFPTTSILGSWYHEPGGTGNVRRDAQVCANVREFPDETIASMTIGGNVRYRPGTVRTGLFSDPERYVVSGRGVLRPVRGEASFSLLPEFMTDHEAIMPDFVFVNYVIGSPVTAEDPYDPAVEYRFTIEQVLGLAP
jgi:hypothetical protein